MWIDTIDVVDVRALQSCSVRLPRPEDDLETPNVTLLLGGNGLGKSSLLKVAAALSATLHPAHDRPLFDAADSMLGRAATWPRTGGVADATAQVTLRRSEPAPRTETAGFTVTRGDGGADGRATTDRSGTAPVVVTAYGAERATEDARPAPVRDGGGRGDGLASLLDGTPVRSPSQGWLEDVVDDQGLTPLLAELLPPDVRLERTGAAGRPVAFVSHGRATSFDELSDGVRSYLSWVLDLVGRLRLEDDDPRAVGAIAFVDEVDQRIHPTWQQSLMPRLAAALPRVQFVCSAHSPMLTVGLRPENLLLLEPARDAAPDEIAVLVRRLREDLYGATVDAALTSSYFQLTSPRSPAFQERLRTLAAEAAGSDEAVDQFMRALVQGSHLQSSLQDRAPTRRRRTDGDGDGA